MMSIREKIILSFMVVTIVVCAWIYFFPDRSSIPANPSDDMVSVKNLVNEIQTKLKHESALELDLQLIHLASSQWDEDPFIEADKFLTREMVIPEKKKTVRKAATNKPNLLYTGFIEVGRTKLAIINGMEYEIGEAVDTIGHFVKHIYPSRIEIGKVGTDTIFLIPLKEFN